MLNAFQQFIKKNNHCTKNDKVLVALSGGLDSIVLLNLFLKSDYKQIGIAHCNFQLRGEESDADENFIRSLASELDIELFVKSCNADAYAEKNKLTIQEAARDLRYAWFEEISSATSFDRIAIAHHADDQIETFFINLFRSSGIAGLKGMPQKRGKIIRPLLFASRTEIEEFANKNKLEFREDSSNASDKYLRNRIRHHLIPEMQSASPQANSSILKSLHYLQEDARVLNQLLEEKREGLVVPKGENFVMLIDELSKYKPLDVWLYYLLKGFGFMREITNDLALTLQNDETISSGKIFHSATHQLLIDRKHLILRKKNLEEIHTEFLIQETDRELKFPIHLKVNIEEHINNYTFEEKASMAYFDFDKLQFPLTVRRWKQGDRFIQFGMKGSKLLSDYFIDNKIDRFTKGDTWLLLSGKTIIWIVGHRASEDFRVGKDCSRIMKVWIVA